MTINKRLLEPESDGFVKLPRLSRSKIADLALMLVHQNTGLTDYIKIEAPKFAKQNCTTFLLNFYEIVDGADVTQIHTRGALQAKTLDAKFVCTSSRACNS